MLFVIPNWQIKTGSNLSLEYTGIWYNLTNVVFMWKRRPCVWVKERQIWVTQPSQWTAAWRSGCPRLRCHRQKSWQMWGKTKTGFGERSNVFYRALHQNPVGSFIRKVDALVKHSRFCKPVSVAHFPYHFPAIVLELSSRTHTLPQLPTQACPHTTPTVNVSSLPYLTCRLHLPFTACIANSAEGPWNMLSWEPTHCSNQE